MSSGALLRAYREQLHEIRSRAEREKEVRRIDAAASSLRFRRGTRRPRSRVYLDAPEASRGATYRDTRAIMRTSDAKAVSASGSLDIARN